MRCAGLALCKPGPVRAGAASRQPPSGSREPAGPGARGRSTSMSTCLRSPGRRGRVLHVRLRCASGPGPLRIRSWPPLRLGPGPRDRHLTREHVTLADVLAGQVTCSRVTRRSRRLGAPGASPGVVAVPVRLPPGSGWSSDCDGGGRSDSRSGRGGRAGSDSGGGAAAGPDRGRPTRFGPGTVPAGRREPEEPGDGLSDDAGIQTGQREPGRGRDHDQQAGLADYGRLPQGRERRRAGGRR